MSKKEETLGWTVIFILNILVFTLVFTKPAWLGGI